MAKDSGRRPAVKRSPAERPAFHFPPMNGTWRRTIRFHVVACLANGGRVPIGSTSNREDAELLARLISPGSGIRVEITGSDEKA